MAVADENPVYGPFFGIMGAAAAIIFSGKKPATIDFYEPYVRFQ